MREATGEKLHVFIVMFFIGLITSMQAPVFTPYAATLGASGILIGLMLSVTSFSDLIGNLFAGPLIDRYGKKLFITFPLLASGGLFILHGIVHNFIDLLYVHALNGFALAFLMPAAFTLLTGFANDSKQQGKNMSIHGLLATISGISAPLVGGKLVELIGYENTYFVIGSLMILTCIYSSFYLKDSQVIVLKNLSRKKILSNTDSSSGKLIHIYLIGFAVMYIHGVLIYEIPYLTVERGISTFNTGQLFSYMGIGTFVILSLFFINNYDPIKRLLLGLFGMTLTIYTLIDELLPLPVSLFFVGIFFGLIMPAMATAITERTPRNMHGRAFGFLSAVYSLGIIMSTFLTGLIRNFISPYFLAFLIGFIILSVSGYKIIGHSTLIEQNKTDSSL